MAYRYYTESVFLEEKLLGWTGAHSTEAITALASRFNALSAQIGKVFKADDRRGVTVAFFCKEVSVA